MPCCFSVTRSYLTFCDSMRCSTPGFPTLHYLLEPAKTHNYWVSVAIQPSHPLLSSPPAFSLSQHQIIAVVSSSHQVAKVIGASASASVLPVNVQGWFPLGLTDLTSFPTKGPSRVFSSTTIQNINSSATYDAKWNQIDKKNPKILRELYWRQINNNLLP